MKADLHNPAAAAQTGVLRGEAETILLYNQGFGW